MRKMLLVAWREFKQRVISRGFIIGSLAVPLILITVWALTGNLQTRQQGESIPAVDDGTGGGATIGYVDQAQFVQTVPDDIVSAQLRRFADEDTAVAALQRDEIEAFYVIPQDYRQSGSIQRVSRDLPAFSAALEPFDQVLLVNLTSAGGAEQTSRLIIRPFNAAEPAFVSLKETDETAGGSSSMLPFLVSVIIMIPLFTSASYLLQSVTQEKSSRIMEILLVSLRPWHILAGKLLGLGGLTLIQYLIWAFIAGLGLLIMGQDLSTLLQGINFSQLELLLVIPYALGGFVLYAGIMAGLGALSPDLEASRSWVFFITLPMMIPIYLWVAIVNAPNSPLALALSMIPFSAPIAILMRMSSATVPPWQLFVSLVLLLVTAVGMVWLMARLFRAQTLLSGESPSVRRFVSALTS